MKRFVSRLLAIGLLATGVAVLCSCKEEGSMEGAGKKLDKEAEKAGDKAADAEKDAKKALDDLGN